MKLEKWALIAEIVGGIAIVVSLIFVGYEMRQNSRSQTQAMTQALVSSYAETLTLLTQNEQLRCIYSAGIRDFSALSGADALAFSAYWVALWRHREDMYFQYQQGALSPQTWEAFEGANREVAQYPGFQQWFAFRRRWFSEPFQEYIDSIMGPPADLVPFEDPACSATK